MICRPRSICEPGCLQSTTRETAGTCVAHAAVAVREFLVGNRGDPDLSEQLVYWACKQRDGNPESGGTYIKFAMDVLKTLGVWY